MDHEDGCSHEVSYGREAALSPVCQLTLPVTDCLPLIHTLTLYQSARKRARKNGVRAGKNHMILYFTLIFFCLWNDTWHA